MGSFQLDCVYLTTLQLKSSIFCVLQVHEESEDSVFLLRCNNPLHELLVRWPPRATGIMAHHQDSHFSSWWLSCWKVMRSLTHLPVHLPLDQFLPSGGCCVLKTQRSSLLDRRTGHIHHLPSEAQQQGAHCGGVSVGVIVSLHLSHCAPKRRATP